MNFAEMIMDSLEYAERTKPLKEIKKGEYFKWDPNTTNPENFKNRYFRKGSYDRSLKKYKCEEYLWKGEGDKLSIWNTTRIKNQEAVYLDKFTLVRKFPICR